MRVSELQPGMMLAQPVRDVTGRLLVNGGTPMTERSILVLKTWGVAEVNIHDEAAPPLTPDHTEEIPPEHLRTARDITSRRLRNNDRSDSFILDVSSMASLRLAKRLWHGERPPVLAQADQAAVPEAEVLPVSIPLLLADNPSLGAMPEAVSRLTEVMMNPTASPAEVADILQTDPALAGKVLKTVNSPFYGFHQHIDTISRAVTIIGVKQLSTLAFGVSVLSLFKDVPKQYLDVRTFWRHSLATGYAARSLASHLGVPNTERFFVAGLLHDVGLMLLSINISERARQILLTTRACGITLVESEKRLLGVDHAEVGGALLASWGLPKNLTQAARYHHDPFAAGNAREGAILHVSDFFAEAMGYGSCGLQTAMSVNPDAWELLKAPPGTARAVCGHMEDQVEILSTIMLGNG